LPRYLLSLMILTLVLGLSACKREPKSPETDQTAESAIPGTIFRKDGELSILAPDGNLRGSFGIELANTERTITQGLMYRESMASNQAMLFDPQGLSRNPFWMKNTYLPLDILFIDDERRIMHIAENTHPFSEETIQPGGIYRYVLEINAGLAHQLKLNIGDTLTWTLAPSTGS